MPDAFESAGTPRSLEPASDGADDAVLQNLPSTDPINTAAKATENTQMLDGSESADDVTDSDGGADEANDSDEDVEADLVQMKTLRSTTSAHDDWLHRGPFLHDMPFHTYCEYIDRVRLPRKAPPDIRQFLFEPHYALSRTYCQQPTTPARVPVLEALKFPPPGEATAEENAQYKGLVGSLRCCTCPDGCSDPLLFKPLLFLAGGAAKPAPQSERWSFRLAWKARRAELEVLATRGEEKIDRAKRVSCIWDTTLFRGWLHPSSLPGKHELLRYTILQWSSQRYGVVWHDACSMLLAFLDAKAPVHSDQLTLAEFSAIRIRRLVQHLDMMAVARTVKLAEKTLEAEHENEDADGDNRSANRLQSEFVGGDHDLNDEGAVDEDDGPSAPHRLAKMDMETVRELLQRDQEIAAASKKGRHRDADMQMKAFADRFRERLTAPLSSIGVAKPTDPKMLGANPKQALVHCQAVRKAMKKEQRDLQADTEKSEDPDDVHSLKAMLAALENLRAQEAQASCTIQPLHELMRGPKHVGELIMEEQAKEGRTLNEEQKTLFALWVDCLQQAFLRRPNQDEPTLPLGERLIDIVIDGGGGCGKSMLINYFFVPLCRAFFGTSAVVLAAPSNKAARGIHGKTMHSLLGFTPDTSLRTSALALTTQRRVKLERTFLNAGAIIEDEYSMLPGNMNHAASLLATYARESKFGLRREDYARPGERYGRMPLVAWCGDHLQLPPVPKKNSLLAPLEQTSQEHRVGASVFRNAQHVFQLQQMMRFKDETLVRILRTMRIVGGQALAEGDWQALLATEAAELTSSAEKPAPVNGWYHSCYLWSVVAMASFMEARESARRSKVTLYYVQAVDILKSCAAPSPDVAPDLYQALLRVPSLTKTKRLPAFCLLHVGMEVRLTTTLDMPWAVQDATGTVEEIYGCTHDDGAEVLLAQLPLAVLIRLHDCAHVFLPCEPCDSCMSCNTACPDCRAKKEHLKGLLPVQPLSKSWRYDSSCAGAPSFVLKEGQFFNVTRRQLPLAPAKVLPLYSMQGMTAEPGLVAHWVLPPRITHEVKWLICYVLLSRVPSLKQLISIGLTDRIREIMEEGPPAGIVQSFSTLFADKIERTHAHALEAKQRLGW